MASRHFALLMLLVVPLTTRAGAMPPLPVTGSAPLLFVRLHAPAGSKAVFFQGNVFRDFETPLTVGLRPGYIYRIKLTNFPDRPGLSLYPTLEVRGTLHLPKVIRASDHPAPVPLSQDDIDRVLRGALLTKVVYLEDPEQALATATRPEQPLELEAPPGGDPLREAGTHGRPLLIVRFGEREFTDRDLAAQSIAGTFLLPGDKALPAPALRPFVPFACVPVIDPLLGPKPLTEECLHDGGDTGPRAGFDRNGAVQGIDPSDTVAAYADSRGRRHLAVSNRVCLCVPRFVVMRAETGLIGYNSIVGIVDARKVEGHRGIESRQPTRQTLQNDQLEAVRSQQRPSNAVATQALNRFSRIEVLQAYHIDTGVGEALGTDRLHKLTSEERTRLTRQREFTRQFEQPTGVRGMEQIQAGPAVVGRAEGLKVVGNVQDLRDLTSSCAEPPRPPDQPLHLYKWAGTQAAQVGDVVTFYLKYANHGGQPISDVAVSDSLTGRLEYVPGSARADRDAVFTTQENQAGSVLLHWEITGRLLPGQSGVVSFQARIR